MTDYHLKTLALAIIIQAVQDYHTGSKIQSDLAKAFLESPDLEFWATPLNVSAPIIRENLNRLSGKLHKMTHSERERLRVQSN